MHIITKYFKNLSQNQISQFTRLNAIYSDWNSKINVISRKDINQLYLHHVLHSLAIAMAISFKPGTKILDAGTGGGFPGIPLAILFPGTDFLLADSITKKIRVVNAVIKELELANCSAVVSRVENINRKFDFVICRAVTALPEFISWTSGKINGKGINLLPNGILYLKGGEIEEELKNMNLNWRVFNINSYFEEEYFESKKIVYINLSENR